MAAFKELSIDLSHITLKAKAWGDQYARPILALHGWLDNAGSFDELAPYFSQYYLIAVDLPGHGMSDHSPKSTHYHLLDSIKYIHEIVIHLQLKNFIFLGHSLGSVIASLYACAAPNASSHLLLIDALGPLSAPETSIGHQLKHFLQAISTNPTINQYNSFSEAIDSRIRQNNISQKAAQILAARGVSFKKGHYYWHHDRKLLLPIVPQLTEVQILTILKEIQIPVCLIQAEKGFLQNQNYLDRRLDAISLLERHVVPGNHHLHMDDPKGISQIFHQFLEKK